MNRQKFSPVAIDYDSHPSVVFRLPITEGASAIRMSRAQFYREIKSGRIRTHKDGRRRFVTIEALREYVAALESPAA